ncbi:MAG: DUF2914 domain-containing protein [Desulfobacterales bacterium]|jgi:hypothetical protein
MKKPVFLRIVAALIVFLLPSITTGQPSGSGQLAALQSAGLVLGKSAVCEDVRNGIPEQAAVAFSVDLKRVYCYTGFNTVPEKSFTYHNWYLKDNLKASVKLTVRPPRWSTYSSIQLRNSDKGPWRIEITDEEGNILKTLRFSVID